MAEWTLPIPGRKESHLYLELWRICGQGRVPPYVPLMSDEWSGIHNTLGDEIGCSIHVYELQLDGTAWKWKRIYESLHTDFLDYPQYYLAWYNEQLYRLRFHHNMYGLLQWFRCATCGKWVKASSARGQAHLRACHRCQACGRCYTGDHHDCHPRPISITFSKRRRLYMKDARATNVVDWDDRPHVLVYDMETFPDATRQNVFRPYAVGRVSLGMDDTPTIFYGRNALATFARSLWEADSELICYGWNSSAFDLLFLLGHFVDEYRAVFNDKQIIKKGKRIVSLTLVNKHAKKIVFKDAYLLIPQSLENAGKCFGVPDDIAKSSFDHSLVYDWTTAERHKEALIKYLRNDVLCTRAVLQAFGRVVYERHKIDICDYLTVSHMAAGIWSTVCRHYVKDLVIPSVEEHRLLYSAVRGGRVQPQIKFWESSQPLSTLHHDLKDYHRMLDANSLYPHSMLGNFMTGDWKILSSGLEERHYDFALPNLNPYSPTDWPYCLYYNFFLVWVRCPKNIITPFLPSRNSDTGALEYTLFDKDGEWYSGRELLHAVHALKYKVKRVYKEWRWNNPPEAAVPLFEEFIHKEYRVRQEHASGTAQNEVRVY